MSGHASVKAILPWGFLWVACSIAFAWFTFEPLSRMLGSLSWEHIAVVIFADVLLALVVLFIHDRTQTDEPIQRMFPVVYWGRWLSVITGPLLRQYWFASDHEEKPYDRVTRNWIYQTSRGRSNNIGFGSQHDFDAIGSYHALPATFTNTVSKTGDETGDHYHKEIGLHTGISNPYTMLHFITISAMSFGSLSDRAIMALNKGAKKAGILHNTGEGGLAVYHEQGGDLIFQMGTAKYGVRDSDGGLDEDKLRAITSREEVKMVEIKLAQGAKPGKGGMLLKEKITKEIAEIRGIPRGVDCHSPPRHKEFDDVDGLFDFIDRVRAIADKPVGIKMVLGHTEELESVAAKMAAEPGRGPDYIQIDGSEGGTGAAPLVLAGNAGLPMKQAIALADWAFKEHGVRDRIALFTSGQIGTPIDVAVAMALGADAVHVARGFMFALGCIQALECHSNKCPTGIATQSRWRIRSLDVDAAADRVAAYATCLEKDVKMLSESCGYKSPDQLTADDIMVVTSPGHLDYLSELHGVSAWEASRERDLARAAGMTVGEHKRHMSLPVVDSQ